MLALLLFVVLILAALVLAVRKYAIRQPIGGAEINHQNPHLNAGDAAAAKLAFVNSSTDTLEYPSEPTFMFYNVHEYRDPFGKDSSSEIANLISTVDAEWIGLAEAPPDKRTKDALSKFQHTLVASNGGTHLVVAWKDPRASAVIVPTTGTRDCILLALKERRIMIVHLEIGTRPFPDSDPEVADVNAKIRANNSDIRIAQLAMLIAMKPDILIGDFNFAPGEPEDNWLTRRGYIRVSDDKRSTPFNRVDHCYVSGAIEVGPSSLLPVAYSDHYPLLQVL